MRFVLVFLTLSLMLCLVPQQSDAAIATDIAISTQAGWFGQAAADREMQEIVDAVGGQVNSIEVFAAADKKALGDWATAHTGNGQMDMILLCGQYPDTLYEAGNGEADDSVGELFLEDGNLIANTGDYMFYVVNAAGTNAATGLQNMMDIPGITMWDDNTAVEVTEDGAKYLPTLEDFQTDRPFHLNELGDEWEAEVVFAGSATRADPVVVRNLEYDGRLAIFYQTASQDGDPRGEVISEFILNWWSETVGTLAVDPSSKLSTTWGALKQ